MINYILNNGKWTNLYNICNLNDVLNIVDAINSSSSGKKLKKVILDQIVKKIV